MDLLHENPIPRRFRLIRYVDSTGTSGVGIVATGVVWFDGVCVLHWNTRINSTTVFQNMEDLVALHGHNGDTEIEYIDQ